MRGEGHPSGGCEGTRCGAQEAGVGTTGQAAGGGWGAGWVQPTVKTSMNRFRFTVCKLHSGSSGEDGPVELRLGQDQPQLQLKRGITAFTFIGERHHRIPPSNLHLSKAYRPIKAQALPITAPKCLSVSCRPSLGNPHWHSFTSSHSQLNDHNTELGSVYSVVCVD